MELYFTCFGAFVIKNGKIIKEHFFTEQEILEFQEDPIVVKKIYEDKFNCKLTDDFKFSILFKEKKYYEFFRKANFIITKYNLSQSVHEDNFIIQSISFIEDSDELLNILSKRLREWVSLAFPELNHLVSNNENFAELSLKSVEDLEKKFKIKTMGSKLEKKHILQYKKLAEKIKDLYNLREDNKKYMKEIMKNYCPNLLEVLDVNLTAKLIAHAGSLKKLGMMPSSKIQLLGAEKALFRHLKTGSKSPKHGLIYQHPFLQNSNKEHIGRNSRALADKITIAARIDYFKGEFIGKKLKKDLEALK